MTLRKSSRSSFHGTAIESQSLNNLNFRVRLSSKMPERHITHWRVHTGAHVHVRALDQCPGIETDMADAKYLGDFGSSSSKKKKVF